MGLFSRSRTPAASAVEGRYGFEYLPPEQVYLDSACQTLRPQPVIDAMNDYYLTHNACGDRVQYAWGRKVDEGVEATRAAVLAHLDLPARAYTASFTLNTTYGINLLLHQLPAGRYRRVITTHTEHNSVFLPTIAHARRAGIERVLLDRDADGHLIYRNDDLTDAIVVISAMNNVNGAPTLGLPELVDAAHARSGIVIIDAAQALPHAPSLMRGLRADAICFSAHKLYGASLGVVVTTNELLESLDVSFVGGGQVSDVREAEYDLLPGGHTRLEPGLQAWGEILALRAALGWLDGYRAATGEDLEARETRLATTLHEGLSAASNLRLLSAPGSSLVTVVPERVDAHRFATFLSKANIMVRSGAFCAHHWLIEREGLPPLLRFSLGAHTSEADIAHTVSTVTRLAKGL
ncbi:MAG: aminotransferase class V-fold PLP-dependent enzyme [Mobilicoccus sp.]|nr:aminotransferase class V-fold PLP-dependent enzyme [Mobilicoccus sp.]